MEFKQGLDEILTNLVIGGVAGIGAVVAAPVVLGAAEFGAAGVAAGSLAAAVQGLAPLFRKHSQFWSAAVGVTAGVAAMVGAPVALGALGFGSAGVVAGSIAAGIQEKRTATVRTPWS
ncbi:hypothetical protein MAR_032448 [Mya arenaria]|uniref:Uncharacterized protein n=1 Tax=Mya arenaria TaxID=6604 RepID=A0ABY7FAN8_MYAAR|nr:hypothetical protein MAR_032448 [Mya arenaria]